MKKRETAKPTIKPELDRSALRLVAGGRKAGGRPLEYF